jgi:ABC-type methionine transport system ATPase subunit
VGGVEILKGIDLQGSEGEITSIVGPFGAGKSTLLRAVNRLIEPTAGEVYLDGTPTSAMNPLELRRRVGMIFQRPALFRETVEDALLYGPHLTARVREADAHVLLEKVSLDPNLKSRNPQNLFVGQQQRVSIARALALDPEVLLMDEPTSSLDEAARRQVEDLIQELNDRAKLTILLVSHALLQVERIANRVVLLVNGRSEGERGKEEFLSCKVGSEKAKRFVHGEL